MMRYFQPHHDLRVSGTKRGLWAWGFSESRNRKKVTTVGAPWPRAQEASVKAGKWTGPDQAMTYKVRAIDRSEVQCKTIGDCEGRGGRVSPYRCCQAGEQQQASTTTSLERGLTQGTVGLREIPRQSDRWEGTHEDSIDLRTLCGSGITGLVSRQPWEGHCLTSI